MGPLRPKIVPFRPDMDPPKHTDYLLLLDVDSESLQYMIVGIENVPSGSERGVKLHPLTPLLLRHRLLIPLLIFCSSGLIASE